MKIASYYARRSKVTEDVRNGNIWHHYITYSCNYLEMDGCGISIEYIHTFKRLRLHKNLAISLQQTTNRLNRYIYIFMLSQVGCIKITFDIRYVYRVAIDRSVAFCCLTIPDALQMIFRKTIIYIRKRDSLYYLFSQDELVWSFTENATWAVFVYCNIRECEYKFERINSDSLFSEPQ